MFIETKSEIQIHVWNCKEYTKSENWRPNIFNEQHHSWELHVQPICYTCTSVRVHVHMSGSIANSVECLSQSFLFLFSHFRQYLSWSLVAPLTCPMFLYEKNIILMQIHAIARDHSNLNTNFQLHNIIIFMSKLLNKHMTHFIKEDAEIMPI